MSSFRQPLLAALTAISILAGAACGPGEDVEVREAESDLIGEVEGLEQTVAWGGDDGQVLVVAGKPMVASTQEDRVSLQADEDGAARELSAARFGEEIVSVRVLSGAQNGRIAVMTCERPHDPDDEELHDPCDAGAEVHFSEIDSEGGTDFESVDPAQDSELVELGVVQGAPYVQTSRGFNIRKGSGDWMPFDLPPDKRPRRVCGTSIGFLALPEIPLSAGTTVPAERVQDEGELLVVDPQVEPTRWKSVPTDGSSNNLVCGERSAAYTVTQQGRTTLYRWDFRTAPQATLGTDGAAATADVSIGGGEYGFWGVFDDELHGVVLDLDTGDFLMLPSDLLPDVSDQSLEIAQNGTYYVDGDGVERVLTRSHGEWHDSQLETE